MASRRPATTSARRVTVLRRLVTGKDGLDKLSGPLGIFKIAGTGTDAQMKQAGVSLGQAPALASPCG